MIMSPLLLLDSLVFCLVYGSSGAAFVMEEINSDFRSSDLTGSYLTYTNSFFDVGQYNENEPCFEEFFVEEAKNAWRFCCSQWQYSANCLNLYEDDFCYESIDVGMAAVQSGYHGYTNGAWNDCCLEWCSSFDCPFTFYCMSGRMHMYLFFAQWWWALLLCACALTVVLIGLCIMCGICAGGWCCMGNCCCKKKNKSSAHQDHSQISAPPIVVYQMIAPPHPKGKPSDDSSSSGYGTHRVVKRPQCVLNEFDTNKGIYLNSSRQVSGAHRHDIVPESGPRLNEHGHHMNHRLVDESTPYHPGRDGFDQLSISRSASF